MSQILQVCENASGGMVHHTSQNNLSYKVSDNVGVQLI